MHDAAQLPVTICAVQDPSQETPTHSGRVFEMQLTHLPTSLPRGQSPK